MTVQVSVQAKMLADIEGRTSIGEPVTLRYDPGDPAVVSVTFDAAVYPDPGDSEPPCWLVARELLANGGGSHCVQVERGDRWLTLTLSSPDGSCRCAIPTGELDAFLDDTYQLVPLGEEITELHLDSAIAEMLGSTP